MGKSTWQVLSKPQDKQMDILIRGRDPTIWANDSTYRSRATTGRSRLVAAPLRFQAKNRFLWGTLFMR